MSAITMNLGYCRLLIDYLSARGYELETALRLLQISERDLADCDLRIPRSAFLAALDAALELTGDANLGLHAGEQVRPNHFGVLGLLTVGCSTGRQMMEFRTRWHQLVVTGMSWEQHSDGDTLRLVRTETEAGYAASRMSIECGMAAQLCFTRWLLGRRFNPRRLCFPYAAPADLSEYRRIFDCPLEFDAPLLELHLPAEFLDMPLLQGNPDLLHAMVARAERLATAQGLDEAPLVLQVRKRIAQRIASEMPEIGDTAASLGLTARQLQLRLAEANTNYTKVIDETRRQLALGYIEDRSISLSDIAFLLGYSEQSAFNHAFRRWTQSTPGEYRRTR